MSQIEIGNYRDRAEPDEPYFEDVLAGEARVPLHRKLGNAASAGVLLMLVGVAVLVYLLWQAK